MEHILKNTLMALYADTPEIIYALQKCDFTKLNTKFKSEMFSRISKEEFEYIDNILHSDAYMRYKESVDQSAMAMTQELANLISFVIENEGNLH